ncbi:hypothetical protein M409DRAFT_48937 [Zasmidium cellare ATCC 36951]|uniref:Uncharacterized protein n=1 Tax=Zasmidium cellare ATCC 36951 TaxID=1080233 RepID=A0A6A6D742_ZASCE|nr:uncharacterized protein M409DRAFT_48937 [Zasmidium cellare ATCC 36951]KAF2174052.1 hypothetical protein M409DRAFT_48937 [Zasmidium cellare ATCC 36951]
MTSGHRSQSLSPTSNLSEYDTISEVRRWTRWPGTPIRHHDFRPSAGRDSPHEMHRCARLQGELLAFQNSAKIRASKKHCGSLMTTYNGKCTSTRIQSILAFTSVGYTRSRANDGSADTSAGCSCIQRTRHTGLIQIPDSSDVQHEPGPNAGSVANIPQAARCHLPSILQPIAVHAVRTSSLAVRPVVRGHHNLFAAARSRGAFDPASRDPRSHRNSLHRIFPSRP